MGTPAAPRTASALDRARSPPERMAVLKTGQRRGSRPQPPEAGARSASLEPGRSPVYFQHSCSPGMLLIPLLGEAAATSWPPWRRMATVLEPIRPGAPITTTFMGDPPLSMTGDP